MRHKRTLTALTVASALALAPSAAHAGGYTVSGTCGVWSPYSNNGARVAVYADGCNTFLLARNTFGNFTSSQGTEGGWRVSAPPGAVISGLSFFGTLKGTKGWDAALFDSGGTVHAVCPGGVNCGGRNTTELNTGFGMSAGASDRSRALLREQLHQHDRTGSQPGARQDRHPREHRDDLGFQPPRRHASSAAASRLPRWKRGNQTLTINASDNVGIRGYEAWVDGSRVGVTDQQGCAYTGRTRPLPERGRNCPHQPRRARRRQPHPGRARAIDSADNAGGTAARRIAVDNHPPLSPQNPAVDGGAGWRTSKHAHGALDQSAREVRADRPRPLPAVPGGGRQHTTRPQPPTPASAASPRRSTGSKHRRGQGAAPGRGRLAAPAPVAPRRRGQPQP